ncbi:MAG: hypothetical protein K0R51_2894 [Cytophagaceae bacterium]|jgi:hypothetical protein|nr:hypothetical protein [Cytophagaceae bacterium]
MFKKEVIKSSYQSLFKGFSYEIKKYKIFGFTIFTSTKELD